MFRLIGMVAAVTAATSTLADDPRTACAAADLVVEGGRDAARQRVCAVAAREVPELAACNVTVPSGLTLRIEDDLPPDCVAVFHCGDGLIRLLPPEVMAQRRERDGAFAGVPDGAYFDSVVVHELTHAAYDSVRCPFSDCVASTEYAAYAMQVRSLPPDARAAFEAASDYDHKVVRDELSAVYYALAPDRFAQKAWLHFSQREEAGCTFIGRIMAGAVFLDREHL